MDEEQKHTDILQLLGSISICASLVLGLVWVFTQLAAL
jgi:hypothetical protein